MNKFTKNIILRSLILLTKFATKHCSPHYTLSYIIKCGQGERIPELEPIIMKDPGTIRTYANDIIRGRWLEAEPFLNNLTFSSYHNRFNVNMYFKKFPEAKYIGTLKQFDENK